MSSAAVKKVMKLLILWEVLLFLTPVLATQWIVGDWSPCDHATMLQTRTVHCITSEGVEIKDKACPFFSKPRSTKLCSESNEPIWRVGPWGECLPSNLTTTLVPCMPVLGQSQRSVICHQKKLLLTPFTREEVEHVCLQALQYQPPSVKNCTVSCPPQCVVSDFGRWSVCDPCTLLKHRSRKLLQSPPQLGSEHLCPPLVEIASCQTVEGCFAAAALSQPIRTFLKVGDWGLCKRLAFAEDALHLGLRHRNLSCMNEMGETVDIGLCPDQRLIPTEETCMRSQDCDFTPWSDWEVLEEGCVDSQGDLYPRVETRDRLVLQMPFGNGSPCPHSQENRTFSSAQSPPCSLIYDWSSSDWGSCHSFSAREADPNFCGGGIQSRVVVCLRNKDFIPVENKFCKEKQPSPVRPCHSSCERNCVVSSWSYWSSFETPIRDMFKPKPRFNKVRTRWRPVKDPGQTDGTPCPHLKELERASFTEKFDWLGWEDTYDRCLPLDNHCGHGVKKLTSTSCQQFNGEILPKNQCERFIGPEFKLDYEEDCKVACPNDCILSKDKTYMLATGKKRCPKKPKTRPGVEGKKENFYTIVKYHWNIVRTQRCVPSEGGCGKGFQTREVECSTRLCEYLPAPANVMECEVPCPVHCRVSNFTDWSPCPNSKCPGEQTRNRFILTLPSNNGTDCPPLVETRKCPSYHWAFPKWLSCFVSHNSTSTGIKDRGVYCADISGEKVAPHHCLYMRPPPVWNSCEVELINETVPGVFPGVSVIDQDNFVDETTEYKCELPNNLSPSNKMLDICLSEEACLIAKVPEPCDDSECPVDCLMEDWSSWSLCKAYHDEYNVLASRQRRVIQFPNNFGRPCPSNLNNKSYEIQTKICLKEDLDKSQFKWSVSAWGPCILTSRGRCGNGKFFRDISCVTKNGTKAPKEQCAENAVDIAIETSKPCRVFCSGECVVSEWSAWSKCSECDGLEETHRTRKLLRTNDKKKYRPCPPLIEKETCETCLTHEWRVEDWNSCLLPSRAVCGEGVQNRHVLCIQNNATLVEDVLCSDSEKPADKTLCYIECPIDCLLSSWGEWNRTQCRDCSKPGTMKRTRYIIQEASSTGQPCDQHYLTQMNACPFCPPQLRRENWSQCDLLPAGDCGWGSISRDVTCEDPATGLLTSDCYETQLPADLEWSNSWLFRPWLKTLVNQGVEKCYVPCPKECPLPEWSAWSECVQNCSQDIGFRTRTRGKMSCRPNSTSSEVRPCLDYEPIDCAEEQPVIKESDVYEPRYFPDDSIVSLWMIALIIIGIGFVAIVIVAVVMIYNTALRDRLDRQPTIRHKNVVQRA